MILPAGIAAQSSAPAPDTKTLPFDLASQVGVPPKQANATKVSGVASWSSGLDPLSPTTPPDQWSVGTTISRAGPWGTLLKGPRQHGV